MASITDMQSELRELATPMVEDLGLEVVDIRLGRSGKRWLLRIDIDRAGPDGVGLDECEAVSRAVGALLEEEAPFEGGFVLEVSSPGLDRPIRTDDDVRRNTGRRVVVETREPLEGRRRFRGVLLGLAGDDLRVEEDEGREIRIARSGILKAHQEIGFDSGRAAPRSRPARGGVV